MISNYSENVGIWGLASVPYINDLAFQCKRGAPPHEDFIKTVVWPLSKEITELQLRHTSETPAAAVTQEKLRCEPDD